MHINIHKPT